MAITLAVAHTDDVCTLHRWRSLVCIVWHAMPQPGRMVAVFRAWEGAARGISGRVMLCAISTPNTGVPEGEAREEMQRTIKRIEGQLAGVVNVVSGTGFQAAALRCVLTGFALVVRPPYPTAFVATPAEAASFIHQHWPKQDAPAPEGAELMRALAAITPR
jgi:hypothetical protein